MPKFPSAEWASAFRTAVNASPEYAEAAKGWDGDILLRLLPDDGTGAQPGIHLDLAEGTCRGATFLEDSRSTSSEFVFEAKRPVWERLVRRELDPVRAVLSQEVKVRGNFAKAMRFIRASSLLIAAAATVPTEF